MTAIKAQLAELEATTEQSAAVAVLCGEFGIAIIEEKDRLAGEPAAPRRMLTGRVDRRWAQRHHPGMAGGARCAAGAVAALRMGILPSAPALPMICGISSPMVSERQVVCTAMISGS